MLPDDKKQGMIEEVKELTVRIDLTPEDRVTLEFIDDFNKRLVVFNTSVTELEDWLAEGRKRLDSIKNANPKDALTPEDRVTKSMEVQEDITKKSDFCAKQETEKEEIFPKAGEKVSHDAKKFMERLKNVRQELNKLDDEVKAECAKFSEDVKYWAEFQTGIKAFDPWLRGAEKRKLEGLATPTSLIEACEILGDSKNFQEECEKKLEILEEATVSSQKMASHTDADEKVRMYRSRWTEVHTTTKEWVARMTTLVECWNKLDGNVGELSSWVNQKDSAAPEGQSEISIEKLETQLNTLKTMFAEKQKLVADLEVYGPAGGPPAPESGEAPATPAPAPAEPAPVAPAEEPAA